MVPAPGIRGRAWAVPQGRYASGAAERATNQRMEITAVLEAVRTLEGPLEVVSDSTYVINCFRERWRQGGPSGDSRASLRAACTRRRDRGGDGAPNATAKSGPIRHCEARRSS